jgi:hypothetical protein
MNQGQQIALRPNPQVQTLQSGNQYTTVSNSQVTVPQVQAPPPTQTINLVTTTTTRAVPAPQPIPQPVAEAAETTVCPTAVCWPRRSWGIVILNVLMFLMLLAVVVLLFVVDLSTNQVADTALIAVTILFGAIAWYMSCECGSGSGADGECHQPAACGNGILDG